MVEQLGGLLSVSSIHVPFLQFLVLWDLMERPHLTSPKEGGISSPSLWAYSYP